MGNKIHKTTRNIWWRRSPQKPGGYLLGRKDWATSWSHKPGKLLHSFWSHSKKPHVILWIFQDWLHVFGYFFFIWKVWSGAMLFTIFHTVTSIPTFSTTKNPGKSRKKAILELQDMIPKDDMSTYHHALRAYICILNNSSTSGMFHPWSTPFQR